MNEKGAWFAIISSIILLSGITGITIYNDVFAAPTEKIEICHKPGTPAEKTMVISVSAWPAHLAHGDDSFACGTDPPPPPFGFVQVSCECELGEQQPEVCLQLFCDNDNHVDEFCQDYCTSLELGDFIGLTCRNDNGCTLP